MRTKTQDRRLLKLIRFLDTLPPEKFNFASDVAKAHTNHTQCATVGCAIGWTPALFPRLVKWKFEGEWTDNTYESILNFSGYTLKGERATSYRKVGNFLFGIGDNGYHSIFYPHEQRGVHPDLPLCDRNATPRDVANMLRKYRELFPCNP